MCINNKIKKENLEMFNRLEKELTKYAADVVYFKWYYKYFGDFEVNIKYNNKVYYFTTDRGDIYYYSCNMKGEKEYNNHSICKSSYVKKTSTYEMLIKFIKMELFQIE